MTTHDAGRQEQLLRELNYYRRECNDLGARLLRLQEEQSQAFREARRSRTTARLVREAYRLADGATSLDAVGGAMLDVIVDNAMCDRAAFLAEMQPGSGLFAVTHVLGQPGEPRPAAVRIANCPGFFFTTAQTRIEPPAYELTGILNLPYILWAYDRASGNALILGNRSESNVSRPFEAGDQELIEGALSVYLDVLTRKQAELRLRRAKQIAEESVAATAQFLADASGALRPPLNSIIGCSEKMASGSRYPLTIEGCAEFADRIHESGNQVLALISGILRYCSFAEGTLSFAPDWRPLRDVLGGALRDGASLGRPRGVRVDGDLAEAEVELLVDADCFGEALSAVVGNAVRASPSAGRVRVAASLRQDGTMEIGVHGSADGSDPPPDPAAEDVAQISLPILRAVVEAHDGQITLHDAPAAPCAIIALPAHRVRTSAHAADDPL